MEELGVYMGLGILGLWHDDRRVHGLRELNDWYTTGFLCVLANVVHI